MIAAMIDGVWLRAALSEWREADSEAARALLTTFVDGRLHDAKVQSGKNAGDVARRPGDVRRRDSFKTINPATGETLAELRCAGPEEINAVVAKARDAQAKWAALAGVERGRVLRRAADLLRQRNDALAKLETRDTGKPIQETRVVDVVSGADCLE